MVRSFQVRFFHFMVRSFHSFSVKLKVKCTLLGLWLKERGIHMLAPLFYRLMKSSDYMYIVQCETI